MSENTESTNAPAIYGQLAQVMADCTHVAKRDRNEHQRFLFRGIDAVVNAVGPILREHKVIVLPQVRDVTYEQVATSGGKASTACRVLVDYVFVSGVDGSTLTARVAAESWDTGDKATPKAMSVAFRTALLQALALLRRQAGDLAQRLAAQLLRGLWLAGLVHLGLHRRVLQGIAPAPSGQSRRAHRTEQCRRRSGCLCGRC